MMETPLIVWNREDFCMMSLISLRVLIASLLFMSFKEYFVMQSYKQFSNWQVFFEKTIITIILTRSLGRQFNPIPPFQVDALFVRTYEPSWLCGQPVFLSPVLFEKIQGGVVVMEFYGRDGECDDEENRDDADDDCHFGTESSQPYKEEFLPE